MNMVVCASKVDPLGVLVALVGLSCCVFGRSSAARGANLRRRAVLLPRLQPRRKRPLRLDGVQAQPRRPLSTASATTSLVTTKCWRWKHVREESACQHGIYGE